MPGRIQIDIELKAQVQKLIQDMTKVKNELASIEGKEHTVKLNLDQQGVQRVISNLDKMLKNLGKGTNNFKQLQELSSQVTTITNEVQGLKNAFGGVNDAGVSNLLVTIKSIDSSLLALTQNITNVKTNLDNMGNGVGSTTTKMQTPTSNSAVQQQEQLQNELKQTESQAQKTAQAVKEVSSQNQLNSNLYGSVTSTTSTANIKTNLSGDEKAVSQKQIQNAILSTQGQLNTLSDKGFVNDATEQKFNQIVQDINKVNEAFKGAEQPVGEYRNQINSLINEYKNFSSSQTEMQNALKKTQTQIGDIQANKAGTGWITEFDTVKTKVENVNTAFKNGELTVQEYKTQIASLINEYLDKYNANQSNQNALNNLINRTQKNVGTYTDKRAEGDRSQEYKNNLNTLITKLEELRSIQSTVKSQGFMKDTDITKMESAKKKIDETIDSFKKLKGAAAGSTETQRMKEIDTISKYMKNNTRISAQARTQMEAFINEVNNKGASANLNKIHGEFLKIVQQERAAGREGMRFMDIFKTKGMYQFIGQVQSYLSMYFGFYGMMNKLKTAVTTVRELDTALIDLKKTTTMSSTQLENFYGNANDVAQQMGVTTKTIIEQAAAWSRLNTIGLLYGDI